jgi:hypothetical protein
MSEQYNPADRGPDQGLLIRDQEGNYYFLRPELLEAAKVPPEEVEAMTRARAPFLKKDDTGGQPKRPSSTPEILGSLKVTRPLQDIDPELADRLRSSATNTHMCPW